jgi:hypothetical protein
MKSLFVVCAMLLALFTASAFADSINLTNQGVIANLGGGGITVISGLTSASLNGVPLSTGPLDAIGIETGLLMGGDSFSSGNFGFLLGSLGASFGAADFAGAFSQLSDGVFQLFGTFSGDLNGVFFNGTTTQVFTIGTTDDVSALFDVSGETNLTSVRTAVPEPGTIPLTAATLLGLAVAFQRKFHALRG